jgi:prolipoprotein diacylglyceryl transferase
MITAFIPAPPFRDLFHIGSVPIHMYSVLMVTAILVALFWSARRAVKMGGDLDTFETIGLIIALCGIVGARLYHVITEHAHYFGPGQNPIDALKIWNGGLGIIGALIGGGLGLWLICRWKGISTFAMLDAIAPTVFVAQAIGRVGNYFNQEAFGKPSTLPWALEVDPAYRPDGYEMYSTFHPTFLYEGLWNVLGCVLLLWAARRFKLQHGKIFALYAMWYTFGRFFIELIRIDPVNTIDGIRINNWTDGVIFLAATALFVFLMRTRQEYVELPLAGMSDKWHGVRPGSPDKTDDAEATSSGDDALPEASRADVPARAEAGAHRVALAEDPQTPGKPDASPVPNP